MNRGIKIVEEIAVVLKDQVLIIVLRKLISDVKELDLFGKVAFRHHAHAVAIHLAIRNRLLGGLGDFTLALCLFECFGQPVLVSLAQLCVRREPNGMLGSFCPKFPFFASQRSFLFFLLPCFQDAPPPSP